jgi:hypothetical protein
LLLSVGAAVFLFGYGVYAFFLGGIDGLAPLPEEFRAGEVLPPADAPPDDEIDSKLRKAFGTDCVQIKQTIKFEIRKKGMVVAASQARFDEPDGRVKMMDLSLALFKENTDSKYDFPEINTLQSDTAWLKFDRPIKGVADTSQAKIVAIELRGHITLINNRHTRKKDDDLEVIVDGEPLFYEENTGTIWTNGFVLLLDKQSRPDPTKISGQGMEMLLARDDPADKKLAGAPKPKGDNSGIDKITLKSTVEMHLYPDGNSGFLNGSAKPAAASATLKDGKLDTLTIQAKEEKKEPEKSHVYISTYGRFEYDVQRDIAVFSSPPPKPNQAYPDQVSVIRTPMQAKGEQIVDQLLCDHLELKFVRKQGATGDGAGTDREIESAHAKARHGTEVVLALDSENLACHCADLFYQCATPKRGPKTTLRGDPLEAVKDGHKIKARELVLEQADSRGNGQQIFAQGPGQVDLFDRSPGKEKHNTHAVWKGVLTSKKVLENNKEMDLLTLTEDAAFLDDEHDQKLFGQRLQVWMETVEPAAQATPVQQPDNGLTPNGSRQRPYKVEAYERVKAEAPDYKISDCSSLKLRFQDGQPPNQVLPPALPSEGAAPPPSTVVGPPLPPDGSSDEKKPGPANPPSAAPPAADKKEEKPKRPIDLKAHDVTADILRTGEKNDLQKLVAEGDVRVHQDGETPKDKGVDIKGETLDLLHFVEGDILKVYGNKDGPAQLQLGELFLIGPKVTINQKENTAWVEGMGAMHMPSNTTFEGGKPSKPGTRLTVHWTRDMIFDGRGADFHGSIVAYQDDSTLRCKNLLQVSLDRPVSFKQGQKEDQSAKVETVVAHGDVQVNDMAKDEMGKVIAERLLNCTQLAVDNKENRFNASGPGTASTLQYGQADALAPQPAAGSAAKQPAPKKEELQLTRVEDFDRMFSVFVNPTTRQTTFLGKVKVVHLPADRLDAKVDEAHLPKGAMVMQCDKLIVTQRQLGEGKSTQVMEAQKRVFCRTEDMYGRAEIMIFDESQDTVTFKGTPGNLAQVWQQVGGPGGGYRKTEAEIIKYNRKDGTVQADRFRGGSGTSGMVMPDRRWMRDSAPLWSVWLTRPARNDESVEIDGRRFVTIASLP